MGESQLRSLILFSAVMLAVSILVWMAHDRYQHVTEEGMVYLELFQPNPAIKEFKNVIALSRPSNCNAEGSYQGLPSDAVDNFFKLNTENPTPVRLSVLEGQVPIVSWKDTKELHDNGTIGFFRPEGYKLVYLSRVGFNASYTEAIACVEVLQNSYSQGVLFHLSKENFKWHIVAMKNIWIS